MNFIIKSCKIENFKGIEHLEFNFNDGLTQVFGDNETGKTTLFDSFVWCLFGKDSSGNATFGITPNFLSNPKSSVVEYECEVDGKPVNYKRSYTAKFNRDKTFKEYKTECFINGIAKGVRDFSLEIGKIIDENVFKLLTNPLYFTEQMIVSKGETVSQRQRKYLYDMASIKSDIDSAKRLKKYSFILDPLERYGSASEYRKFLKSKISEEKRSSEDFLVKIEQQSENLINIDFNQKELNDNIKKIDEEIEYLRKEEEKIKNDNSKEEMLKKYFEIDSEIKKLEIENDRYKEKVLQEMNEEIQKSINEKRKVLVEISEKANNYFRENLCISNEFDSESEKKENIKEKLEQIKNEYKEKLENIETTCPTCKRPYDKEMISNSKSKIMSILDSNFTKLKKEIDGLEKKQVNLKERLKIVKEEQMKCEEKERKLKEEISLMIDKIIDKDDIEDMVGFNDLIDSLHREKLCINSDIETENKIKGDRLNTIYGKIKLLTEQLNDLKEKSNLIEYNKRCEEKISLLIEQQKKTNKEIERLQKEYDLVTDFIQFKMKSATEKINSLFESVKWELFRVNGEGNTEEICVPYVNGTQYKDLSASAKIFCGIDIIKTFKKQYNMSMPVFIDNKERITSDIPITGQIITLTAKEECCPKCDGKTGRKQENRKWKCERCGWEFEKSLKVM